MKKYLKALKKIYGESTYHSIEIYADGSGTIRAGAFEGNKAVFEFNVLGELKEYLQIRGKKSELF